MVPAIRCVQVISKKKLVSAEEIGDVQREVQIMHHLAGHHNVVCLKVGPPAGLQTRFDTHFVV